MAGTRLVTMDALKPITSRQRISGDSDGALLERYVAGHSDDAFRKLAERHVNLVFTTCLRDTCDRTIAEDTTQTVFIILAEKAASLTRRESLAGWLFLTARLVSHEAIRREKRRKAWEAKAMAERELIEGYEAFVWKVTEPGLQDALSRLRDAERNAVLLRFYEERSYREIGETLGVSEAAAERRVARALLKLRTRLRGSGATISAGILASVLAGRCAHAAPETVVHTAAAVPQSLVTGSAGAAQALAAANRILGRLHVAAVAQAVVALMTVAVVGVGFGYSVWAHAPKPIPALDESASNARPIDYAFPFGPVVGPEGQSEHGVLTIKAAPGNDLAAVSDYLQNAEMGRRWSTVPLPPGDRTVWRGRATGRGVTFTCHATDKRLWMVDDATGKTVWSMSVPSPFVHLALARDGTARLLARNGASVWTGRVRPSPTYGYAAFPDAPEDTTIQLHTEPEIAVKINSKGTMALFSNPENTTSGAPVWSGPFARDGIVQVDLPGRSIAMYFRGAKARDLSQVALSWPTNFHSRIHLSIDTGTVIFDAPTMRIHAERSVELGHATVVAVGKGAPQQSLGMPLMDDAARITPVAPIYSPGVTATAVYRTSDGRLLSTETITYLKEDDHATVSRSLHWTIPGGSATIDSTYPATMHPRNPNWNW